MSTTTSSAAAAIPSSSSKPSPTTNVKPNRLPAPTLFVGPPSRNASHLSVSRQQTNESRTAGKSALGRNVESASVKGRGEAGRPGNTGRLSPPPNVKKASEKSIEAKWKDMQSTLNEVEFTAQSSTHVFGEAHARALDELRRAQVELARAWGRGMNEEEGEKIDTGERFRGAQDLAQERSEVRRGTGRERSDTNSTALSDESLRSDVTSKSGRSQLEDETAQDIKLASERRANNEAYFKKVEGGVREVVKKLEVVAEAMRGVEGESRSLWSESSGTTTTTNMGGGESEVGGRKGSGTRDV